MHLLLGRKRIKLYKIGDISFHLDVAPNFTAKQLHFRPGENFTVTVGR